MYLHPFVNQCQVTIPGMVHPYETTDLAIWALDRWPDPQEAYEVPSATIDLQTLDLTVTFPVPQTGVLLVATFAEPWDFGGQGASAQSREPSWVNMWRRTRVSRAERPVPPEGR